MVGLALGEGIIHPLGLHIAGHYEQFPHPFTQRSTLGEEVVVGDVVQFADKLAGVVVDLLVALLEFVQFFEYYNGKINIILLEIFQTLVIVQDDIGVNYKIFLGSHNA